MQKSISTWKNKTPDIRHVCILSTVEGVGQKYVGFTYVGIFSLFHFLKNVNRKTSKTTTQLGLQNIGGVSVLERQRCPELQIECKDYVVRFQLRFEKKKKHACLQRLLSQDTDSLLYWAERSDLFSLNAKLYVVVCIWTHFNAEREVKEYFLLCQFPLNGEIFTCRFLWLTGSLIFSLHNESAWKKLSIVKYSSPLYYSTLAPFYHIRSRERAKYATVLHSKIMYCTAKSRFHRFSGRRTGKTKIWRGLFKWNNKSLIRWLDI